MINRLWFHLILNVTKIVLNVFQKVINLVLSHIIAIFVVKICEAHISSTSTIVVVSCSSIIVAICVSNDLVITLVHCCQCFFFVCYVILFISALFCRCCYFYFYTLFQIALRWFWVCQKQTSLSLRISMRQGNTTYTLSSQNPLMNYARYVIVVVPSFQPIQISTCIR